MSYLNNSIPIEEPLRRPSPVTKYRTKYKTIEEAYVYRFDEYVNKAIDEGWKLDRRFINTDNVFVAFMSKKERVEELEEYNER